MLIVIVKSVNPEAAVIIKGFRYFQITMRNQPSGENVTVYFDIGTGKNFIDKAYLKKYFFNYVNWRVLAAERKIIAGVIRPPVKFSVKAK